MRPRCSTKPGTNSTKSLKENGKKLCASSTSISNRYGKRCLKVLCPQWQVHQNEWVFKIKCNCLYGVHLVACKYSQVPGIDFSENYSLVIINITFCILLLIMFTLDTWPKKSTWRPPFSIGNLKKKYMSSIPKVCLM